MIFGKIAYLNLLPFHAFMKRYLRHNAEKGAWLSGGGVPAKVNRDFRRGRVDAAVISSIRSRGCDCTDLGIIADGEVMSVLALPGRSRPDGASETSNALARVLGVEGEVVIGDRALALYFQKPPEGTIDLAKEWKRRYGLPFVFARLCAAPRYRRRVTRMARLFHKAPVRVPYTQRRKEATRHGLSVAQLDLYLSKIYYRMGWREKRGLALFLKKASRLRKI
jgi:chorismate dehydratase